ISHGDTSTTMAQPLAGLGRLCREEGIFLYVDATATLGGMNLPVDAWHLEEGLQDSKYKAGEGPIIRSNYFDLAMIMDYWSDKALNHHTEATSMLYAARECARVLLQEGLPAAFERHARASKGLTEGLQAMGLKLFGDQAHKMAKVTGVHIPAGVDGERVRHALLNE